MLRVAIVCLPAIQAGMERRALQLTGTRYDHDCSDCIFLGQYEHYDLYFCPNEPTIVARYSSEGRDYCSGIAFAMTSNKKCYAVALIRALQTKHKDKIIEYVRKYHSEFPERIEKFSELRLIAEANPKDYPTLIGHLKHYAFYIEEHFKEHMKVKSR